MLRRSFGVQNISDIAALEPITQGKLSLFQRNPLIHGPDISLTRLDTSLGTAIAMSKADWNKAVIDMLAEEAATLVFSSQRISEYLSGHSLDWRAWFSRRLYDIFLDLQFIRGSKTSSELKGTLEKRVGQKRVEKGKRAALTKVSCD